MEDTLTLLNIIMDNVTWFNKDLFKKYRLAKGLTQKDLARALGCSVNTISSLEVGRFQPHMPLYLSICEFFDVDFTTTFTL